MMTRPGNSARHVLARAAAADAGAFLARFASNQALFVLGVLIAAAALVLGVWMQTQVLINHDVGWIVHSAGWLLDGKRFGRDVLDVNPPLIWFVSMPAAAIARAGWLTEAEAIRAWFWLLGVMSLWFCHRLLLPLWRAGHRFEATGIFAGIAIAFAVLPGPSFGQREFLAFVLGIPYCLLIANRLAFEAPVERVHAIVAGTMGGIAFAFKPWLLAVPAAIEILHVWRARSWRSFIRPETLALIAILFLYAAAIVVFTPDYLTVAVPFARSVYWLFGRRSTETLWVQLSEELEPLFVVGVMLLVTRSFPVHSRVFVAALAGFAFNFWCQRKGFSYHLYPVTATVLVIVLQVCGFCLDRLVASSRMRPWLMVPAVLAVVLVGIVNVHARGYEQYGWTLQNAVGRSAYTRPRERLIQRLQELSAQGYRRVYSFSTLPYPSYPTLNYVDAVSGNSQLCLFAFSGYLKRAAVEDDADMAALVKGTALQTDLVMREFLAQPADVVLVNTRVPGPPNSGFDFIRYFSADSRFAAVWREYVELPRVESIRIFVRAPQSMATAAHPVLKANQRQDR